MNLHGLYSEQVRDACKTIWERLKMMKNKVLKKLVTGEVVIIDTVTGETKPATAKQIAEYLLDDVAYVRTHEQQDAWERKKKEQEEQEELERVVGQRDFAFNDMDNIKGLMEAKKMKELNLTDNQIGYFYMLTTFIDYDGFIRPTSKQPPVSTQTDIKRLIGIKNNATVKETIKALTDSGLLYKETYTNLEENIKGKKCFKINSDYAFKGGLDGRKAVKSYSKTIRDIYEYAGVDAVSFLVPLIPYIGLKHNALVANPYAKSEEAKPLTLKDIQDITGFSRSKVGRKVRELTYKDMYVFSNMTIGRTRLYVINPLALYRKEGEPTGELVELFKINKKTDK